MPPQFTAGCSAMLSGISRACFNRPSMTVHPHLLCTPRMARLLCTPHTGHLLCAPYTGRLLYTPHTPITEVPRSGPRLMTAASTAPLHTGRSPLQTFSLTLVHNTCRTGANLDRLRRVGAGGIVPIPRAVRQWLDGAGWGPHSHECPHSHATAPGAGPT
jgi:hypothetical protein